MSEEDENRLEGLRKCRRGSHWQQSTPPTKPMQRTAFGRR